MSKRPLEPVRHKSAMTILTRLFSKAERALRLRQADADHPKPAADRALAIAGYGENLIQRLAQLYPDDRDGERPS